jgi:type I restriction enzyme M protein
MAVGNLVKRLQDIMRKDAGINGDAQRIEQMVWMFFLKVYDAAEEDWELDAEDKGETFKSIIPEPLRWRNWAPSKDEEGKEKNNTLTGQSLLDFINEKLFRVLKGEDSLDGEIKGIQVTRETARHQAVVRDVFQEVNQYMKNGVLLRQMIDEIDAVDLLDTAESHAFGDMYETLLKDLQAAGNAGEFYTPRPLTDFTVEHINPKLGELMGDLAAGTGGFIISTLKHLEKQKKTAKDEDLYQQSVMGQEWKPFPYLLGVTNIMLHGIKDPQFFHMDSLGKNMSEYQEDGKLDTIAMNPPYGGATDAAAKMNFKAEYRSSETADLFMVLIMQRLNRGGRAGVVVPDGFLFGTEGAKFAIKKRLLTEFNLHTIIRLPGSVFSPYTSIATNILFFNNERAEGAPEGYATKETWFYRMDMPEGYKHFSKTRPILNSHFDVVNEWWENRQVLEEGEKSRSFTPQELMETGCNFDQCKFPKEEEEVLRPEELLKKYHKLKDVLNEEIENIVGNFEAILDNKEPRFLQLSTKNPCGVLSDLIISIPERLKKSILQEAIEGRLVPQDPNDEPASVLLDKIRKEKAKLVKEKKIKKKDIEVPLIIDEDIPYKIPENWTWCRLKEICDDFIVPQRDKPTRFDGDIPWCRIEDIEGKYLNGSKSNQLVTKELADSMNMHLCPKGTVICACSASIGNQAITTVDCYTNQTFIGIVCKDYALYNEYLYYFFMSQKQALKDLGKGTTISYISRKKFEDYLFPLPPLAEQKRIVTKIEQLLHEIDKLKV